METVNKNDQNSLNGIASIILGNYDSLSDSEKTIGKYIIDNSELISNLTVYQLAEATNASAATIVRFCKSIGFKGYGELKYYIQHGVNQFITGSINIESGDSSATLKQKVAAFNKNAIDDSLMTVDDQELDRAIDAIFHANRVSIYAEGGSAGTALCTRNAFANVGIQSVVCTDAFDQMVNASFLNSSDVAIGICHRGDIINTIDAMCAAKENGATTIAIVGYPNSTLGDSCDIVLRTSSQSLFTIYDIPTIRMCEMFIINILQVGLIYRHYDMLEEQAIKARSLSNKKRISYSGKTSSK